MIFVCGQKWSEWENLVIGYIDKDRGEDCTNVNVFL